MIKHILAVVTLIIVSFLCPFLFLKDFGYPYPFPDTVSYTSVAKQLVTGEVIDTTVRTPVYPAFIAVVQSMFGEGNAVIVYAHLAISILAVLAFYVMGLLLTNCRRDAFVAAFLIAVNLNVVSFQNTILSETLSIFLLTLVVLIHLLLLKTNSILLQIVVIALEIPLIFVRPSLMLLPVVLHIYQLIIAKFTQGPVVYEINNYKQTLNIIGIVIVSVSLWAYYQYNLVHFEYPGISRIGEINFLGKLAQYGYLGKLDSNSFSNPDSNEVAGKLREAYLSSYRYRDPWELLYVLSGSYSPDSIGDVKGLGEVTSTTLRRNLVDYVLQTIKLLPSVFTVGPHYYAELAFDPNILGYRIYVSIAAILRGAMFLLGCYIFIYELLFGNREYAFKLGLIISVIGYVVLVITAYSYAEYFRLRIAVEPLMDILMVATMLHVLRNNHVLLKKRPSQA